MKYRKIILTITSAFVAAFFVTSSLVNAANLDQAVATLPADDEWSVMAYATMGQAVGQNFLQASLRSSSATDYEKRILAITAIGENPSTYGQEDFLAKLESMFDGTQVGDPALLNDDIFGLLALSSAGRSGTITDKLREKLLNTQNGDGGWGFALGVGSDSNMTAMAVSALRTTGSAPQSAIDYLKSTQTQDSGYGFTPGQEADGASTAWVISGLVSAGESVPAEAKTFLENLQLSDGSFKWKPSDASGSQLVTAFAVVALSGNTYPINSLDSAPPPNESPLPEEPVPPPSEGPEMPNHIPPAPSTPPNPSPDAAIPDHCKVLIYHKNFAFPPEGGRIVESDGHLYFVKTYEAGCGEINIKTNPPNQSPPPNSAGLSAPCLVPIYHTNFAFPPEGGRIVESDGHLYFVKTYEAGCQDASDQEEPAPVPVPLPRPHPNPSPLPNPQTNILLQVSHPGGTIFSGQANLPESASALSVLRSASSENNFQLTINQTALGEFVYSIGGIAPSGISGWQYAVNGTAPSIGAGDFNVSANDSIQWFYGPPGTNPY